MPSPRPSDAALLRRQSDLQAEADRLLTDLDLLAVLATVGEPLRLGSSVLGLMVWRDLDVVVHAPGLGAAAMFRALLPVLGRPGLLRADYRNEHGADAPGGDARDAPHYLVLRFRAADEQVWKIDLTFWTGAYRHDHEGYTRAVLERLDPESRLAILRLKERWHRLPCYPDVVSGYEIYDAVLNHGVRTAAELRAFLRVRGLPCG